MSPAVTPLNWHGLRVEERLPEVSDRLMVLERLFAGACETKDETAASYWRGLRDTVRGIRQLVDDIYEQGQTEEPL
ncbi:MAG TPA: hypothetical protein VN903_30180 [Polyangia bacterium]|nr:hypothetical protein [Polyangia bacterium]